jgi:hypothetical protein
MTDARNLPKPVKVALRTRDKVALTQNKLQQKSKPRAAYGELEDAG